MLPRAANAFRAARLSRLTQPQLQPHHHRGINTSCRATRTTTTNNPSGSILPEPKRPRYGYLGVILAISTGLFIGSAISANIANFLEENELFVPSDDDDDDD